MGKKATKAADNMYYLARSEAAEFNEDLSSREKAAELVGIDRTRLARIELDTISPYPEEVKAMAKVYNTPELCNSYCGYIPTKRAFEPNCDLYETSLCHHSCLIPEAGDMIVDRLLEMDKE